MKRTQITIERHSITVIRATGNLFTAYCECCRTRVAAFAPDQVADILCIDIGEVCLRLADKKLHLTNRDRGPARICGNSLGTEPKQ